LLLIGFRPASVGLCVALMGAVLVVCYDLTFKFQGHFTKLLLLSLINFLRHF
jgi:hypothetical protein